MRKIMFRGKFKIKKNRGYYSEEEINFIESKIHDNPELLT